MIQKEIHCQSFLLRPPLEDEGTVLLRNVGNRLHSDVASHPRRNEQLRSNPSFVTTVCVAITDLLMCSMHSTLLANAVLQHHR